MYQALRTSGQAIYQVPGAYQEENEEIKLQAMLPF